MKQLLVTFLGIFALVAMATTDVTAQSANGQEAQVVRDVRQACSPNFNGGQYEARLIILGLCAEPTGHEFAVWEVWFVPNGCPPPQEPLCLPAPSILIGTVTYDCEGNTTVDCQL